MGKTLEDSAAYQRLASLIQEPYNAELRAWKESGGKIVGVLYNQVPEEIITAAGMVAYRVRDPKAAGDELANARFTQVNCSLARVLYDSAARGRFGFIDGLVATNACDHIRKLWENWKDSIDVEYSHLICFPKAAGPERAEELARRFGLFKADFEAHYGVSVSDGALREAIVLHNSIRSLQARLQELRQADAPKLTGTQFLTVMIAGTCMPKAAYKEALEQVIADAGQADGIQGAARLMVYGGEIDSPQWMSAIESQGALVVGDSLGGYGHRGYSYQVATEGDLLRNLAFAMLNDREPEPRIHDTRDARWADVVRIMGECRADGIVQIHVPICDLWSYERMMFDTFVRREDIPCLDLDTEYIFTGEGQTRTRVQAFVETLTEGGR